MPPINQQKDFEKTQKPNTQQNNHFFMLKKKFGTH